MSNHSLQSVMNEHLNHLEIYTNIPKFRSALILHRISTAEKIISGWLTVNM